MSSEEETERSPDDSSDIEEHSVPERGARGAEQEYRPDNVDRRQHHSGGVGASSPVEKPGEEGRQRIDAMRTSEYQVGDEEDQVADRGEANHQGQQGGRLTWPRRRPG